VHDAVKTCTPLSKSCVAPTNFSAYLSSMHPELIDDLRDRSASIRERWETFLRGERVTNPMANPDVLVYLIPETLDQVLEALENPSRAPVSIRAAKAVVPDCDCGNNPYSAYFIAGEQALCETLVLLQSISPVYKRQKSDLSELVFSIRKIAKRDIDLFCSACAHRGVATKCRYRACHDPVWLTAV
jgi:hypothetical protein